MVGWDRVPRPTGGVSYGTRVPVREGTGVVPGPLGAFPGAPRCEGQSGRGSGEAREGRLFPIGPRSLRLLKRRGFGESSTKPRAERGMRPGIGPPLPGPGGSEGGVGGTWVGWGLASRGLHPSEWTAVQGILKSLLQHHTSKASILRCSAFFRVQLSHPYMTTGKTIA